jgi:uncharacterized protein YigA (DUF484 family)
MTKQSSSNDTAENSERVDNTLALNKESVANYLLENPSFLIDNPDLLVQIQVHLQENGVVSLTQIQASQSREKIRQLKAQLEEMVTNARQNELIYKTYAELNFELARSSSVSELESNLNKHLVNTLGLESAHIVLLNSEDKEQQLLSEIQQRSLFDKKLARQPFYFGRIGNIDKEALFPKLKAESVALILLTENEDGHKKASPIGLLAISSKDPLHFQPDIDTVLVEYLRKNINFHLNRLL